MNLEKVNGQIAPVDLRDGTMPPIETHPIAVSRFPREVRTEYYRRRADDGGYGGNDRIFTGTSTFSEDLTLALATGANQRRKFSLSEAMVIASEACERCMNALAHHYGLADGYPELSEAWKRCRTECVMCRDEHPLPPVNPSSLAQIASGDAPAESRKSQTLGATREG